MSEKNGSVPGYDFLFEDSPLTQALGELGFFAIDVETGKVICSSLWLSWGYNDKDMRSNRLLEICHPDDHEKVSRLLQNAYSGETVAQREIFRVKTADGRWVWILHCGNVVSRTASGDLKLYVGTDTDLSTIKEAEEQLQLLKIETELRAREAETLQKAAAVITSSLDINETVRLILEQARIVVPFEKVSVQILTPEGLEVIGGHGFRNLPLVMGLRFPYPEEGSLSTKALQEKSPVICGDVLRDFPKFVESEAENPTLSWMGIPLIAHNEVFGLLAFDHSERDFFTEKYVKLASGFAVHVAVALENARLHERTYKLAMEDALMEIGSRHCFDIQGHAAYEDARRRQVPLALVMVDLDHFKQINDIFGHDHGDLILKEVGRLCRKELRISDLAARYGGEEVVLLLPDTDEETAYRVVERLRIHISEHDFEQTGITVTISSGIAAEIPGPDSSLIELIRRADTALYSAKHKGRNRTERYKAPF